MTNFNVANDITELIGKTPIVKMNRLTKKDEATIYAKLEWYNIGGSIKDRMALNLIEYAEAAGKINKEKIILEATSGNAGISLAMIAAAKGYKMTIVMPESVSIERERLIKAYGAELVLSPGEKGTGGAIEMKEKMLQENPDKYINIDQFKEPANILAHYQTTGKELWEQMGGKLDLVVVGIGTSGTGVGTSMRLKFYDSKIKIIGITPKLGVSIQGIRNPKEPYPTQLFRKEWFDEIVEIAEKDVKKTFELARRIAREEGILMGISGAAIMYVALQKAKEIGMGKTIVTIIPDDGMKYLSTSLFE
ncbi:PLP-dependent cysteine synthase family protein [[Eubacterium] cellulosolvens]